MSVETAEPEAQQLGHGSHGMANSEDSSDKNKAVQKERVQSFLIDAAKILGPALIAIVVMYVKVQVQETAIDRLQSDSERSRERSMALETKIIALEAQQRTDKTDASSGQREVIAALKRVEEDIKELKGDVKDLRKSAGRP